MATSPKRGRGRPPLTEAEKKKREKRAQKAKEEAAAKREKEREKKKQQMLNKRKSIRSQVSKKVKEQQELAITRSKMLNTGDLKCSNALTSSLTLASKPESPLWSNGLHWCWASNG